MSQTRRGERDPLDDLEPLDGDPLRALDRDRMLDNISVVIRHTLVQELNLGWEEEYAVLDRIADPTFVEPKGFVFVGDSRKRMSIDNMPSHARVTEFGRKLAGLLGMELLKEKADSRVVLLGEANESTELPL